MMSEKETPEEQTPYQRILVAQHLRDDGRPEEAVERLEKIIEETTLVEDSPSTASAYQQLGVTYGELGRWDQAVESYMQALNRYELVQDEEGMGNVHRDIGLSYLAEDDYKSAEVSFTDSIRLLKGIKEDPHGVALSTGKLAVAYAAAGNYRLAEETFQEAVQLAERAFMDGQWWAHVTISVDFSRFLFERKRYEEAFRMANEGLIALLEGTELEGEKMESFQAKRQAQLYGMLWQAAIRLPDSETIAPFNREMFLKKFEKLSESQKRDVLVFLGNPEI